MSKPSYGQKAYERGYADAMNWKTQNHLEHLPPKREWVGLTDWERLAIWMTVPAETEDRYAFAKAIEAKLKEKNHD